MVSPNPPIHAPRARSFPVITSFLVLCGFLSTMTAAILRYRAVGTLPWFEWVGWEHPGGEWRRAFCVSEEKWVVARLHPRALSPEDVRTRASYCERVGTQWTRESRRADNTIERSVLSHDEYLTYIAGRPLTDEEKTTMRNDVRKAIRYNQYWDWMHNVFGFLLNLLLLPYTLCVLFNLVWHWRSRHCYFVWGLALLTALNWAFIQPVPV